MFKRDTLVQSLTEADQSANFSGGKYKKLSYDEFVGKGKETWTVTYSSGRGRGGSQTSTMSFGGMPVGSKEKDVQAAFKKRFPTGKKFISAKYVKIREEVELEEASLAQLVQKLNQLTRARANDPDMNQAKKRRLDQQINDLSRKIKEMR